MIKKLSRYRIAIFLSLFCWLLYGEMTNKSDLEYYELAQAEAESIVQYHTFALGESTIPGWKDVGDGDMFYYNNKRLVAKQPGSFVFAAIPYFFLYHFGDVSYQDHRLIISALVSWLSAGLLAAISVGVFYELLLLFGNSAPVSGFGALAYGIGSTIFPYSGIPHHDVIAAAFLVFALYHFKLRSLKQGGSLFFAGTCLGLTLFVSMLPALIVACLLVYSLFLGRLKDWIKTGSGFLTGAFPLALYNWHYFDSPFRQANVAGNYKDTFFHFSIPLMKTQFWRYFNWNSNMSATQLMPIFLLGVAGCFFIPKTHRREKILLISAVLIHLFYLFNIDAEGHCQFGPRYLIPLVPLALIGLGMAFPKKGKFIPRLLLGSVAVSLFAYSIGTNALGAIGDSMYCLILVESPIHHYWTQLSKLTQDAFPLLPITHTLALVTLAGLGAKELLFPKPVTEEDPAEDLESV